MPGFGSTDGVLAAAGGSTDGVPGRGGGSTDGVLVVAGTEGSRQVGQSVVSDLLDIFACPRKIISLSGSCRLLWQRDKVIGLLLPSSGVETNSVDGCAIRSPACSGSRSKECWAIRMHGRRRRKAIPTIPSIVVLSDPASEFSDLYRLVDVCAVRDIRVTMPAGPVCLKAVKLAAALRLPVRVLPGQPTAEVACRA